MPERASDAALDMALRPFVDKFIDEDKRTRARAAFTPKAGRLEWREILKLVNTRRGQTFAIDPCIPTSWSDYRIVWRFLDSRYEITVSNPTRRCRGVAKAMLDGAIVNAAAIPLVNDGGTHDVQIVLGDPVQHDLLIPRLTVASERG